LEEVARPCWEDLLRMTRLPQNGYNQYGEAIRRQIHQHKVPICHPVYMVHQALAKVAMLHSIQNRPVSINPNRLHIPQHRQRTVPPVRRTLQLHQHILQLLQHTRPLLPLIHQLLLPTLLLLQLIARQVPHIPQHPRHIRPHLLHIHPLHRPIRPLLRRIVQHRLPIVQPVPPIRQLHPLTVLLTVVLAPLNHRRILLTRHRACTHPRNKLTRTMNLFYDKPIGILSVVRNQHSYQAFPSVMKSILSRKPK